MAQTQSINKRRPMQVRLFCFSLKGGNRHGKSVTGNHSWLDRIFSNNK
jgi:hypothetical protein